MVWIRSQSSSETWSRRTQGANNVCPPTTVTSTSSPPRAATASATTASRDAGERTSTPSPTDLAGPSSSANACAASRFRSATATAAPAAANAREHAPPLPGPAPPITRARLPSSVSTVVARSAGDGRTTQERAVDLPGRGGRDLRKELDDPRLLVRGQVVADPILDLITSQIAARAANHAG